MPATTDVVSSRPNMPSGGAVSKIVAAWLRRLAVRDFAPAAPHIGGAGGTATVYVAEDLEHHRQASP